ncbi:vWA domain-containing protein [Maricaulis sp.]|uniref:vWA domain-containing protein n=1 Tax=Maricaulis sp. TaxID=1486257 RepID=UPI000C4D8728|nr:vWA domain-containing protein [Maricaulis sp.]MAC90564.1 pilus assembly protein TadG [Maricaulis sp.]
MPFQGLFNLGARLCRETRGNVATIFALTLVPVALLSGGAVDLSQSMNARSRLAQALDAAALAVGVNTSLSSSEATGIANDFIDANYPGRELGVVQNVNVYIDDETDTVTVSGEARVRTTMLGMIGLDYITVHWESEVQRARQRLELVMVLDNTGSMGGSKIRNLRDSAELLTEILFDAADDPEDVKIGLVPFAATVNLGTNYERAWWLDPDALSPLHAEWAGGSTVEIETCTGRRRRRRCTTEEITINHWDLFDDLRNTPWGGCVEARAIPHDIEDTPPSRSDPQTLFVPYFAPDEPDDDRDYSNDYLGDGLTGELLERLLNLLKYDNGRPSGGGPNMACTTTPITPLTSNRSRLLDAINDMGASGTTNIPQGVGWGVRVLSPQEPFTEGTSYDDREIIKAMVILTDGENVLRGRSTDLRSDYSAYGFSVHGRLGTTSSSSSTLADRLDNRLEEACAYAKSQGIRVYTITFQVNSSSTRSLMQDCASNPSLYFDSPSSEALEDAFEMIAGDLTNLRLSR